MRRFLLVCFVIILCAGLMLSACENAENLAGEEIITDAITSKNDVPAQPKADSEKQESSQAQKQEPEAQEGQQETEMQQPLYDMCYYELDKNSRAYYEALSEAAVALNNQKILISSADADALAPLSIKKAHAALLTDKPELFYIGEEYSLTYNPDNKGYYVELEFIYDLKEIEQLKGRLEEVVEQISFDNMSYQEAQLAVIGQLCATELCEESEENQSNAYSALVGKKADSKGIARAAQLLLRAAGINATTVKGELLKTGSEHFWNVAELSGRWYHIDLSLSLAEGKPYKYYNISDNRLALTHKIYKTQVVENNDKFNIALPECLSDDFGYEIEARQ